VKPRELSVAFGCSGLRLHRVEKEVKEVDGVEEVKEA
jgi:hypothetical protein